MFIIKIKRFEWLNTLFLEPKRVLGLSSVTPFLSDSVSSFIRVAGSESSETKEKDRKKLLKTNPFDFGEHTFHLCSPSYIIVHCNHFLPKMSVTKKLMDPIDFHGIL